MSVIFPPVWALLNTYLPQVTSVQSASSFRRTLRLIRITRGFPFWKLVLVEIDGERLVRPAAEIQGGVLLSATGNIDVREELRGGAANVLGVVTYAIHTFDE